MQEYDYRTQIDVLRERSFQIGAGVGLIVGLLIGWLIIGWWLAPINWVDARPGDLHPDWQKHYVAMVVDSYILSRDSETAEARLDGFDRSVLPDLFGEVEAEFEREDAMQQAQETRQLAELLGVTTVVPTPEASPLPVTPRGSTEGTTPWWRRGPAVSGRPLLLVCAIVLITLVLIVGGILVFFWYQRRRIGFAPDNGGDEPDDTRRRPPPGPAIRSIDLGEQAVLEYQGEGPGHEQTVQVYRGDEIVAECGLRGVSTLSDGHRVVACSVWLYEPQVPERPADTCVVASRRIYQNEALRSSLTHEREPGQVIPAEEGQTAHLEHESLEMKLQVMDVEHTDPEEQYIGRLVVELETIIKPGRPETAAPFDFT